MQSFFVILFFQIKLMEWLIVLFLGFWYLLYSEYKNSFNRYPILCTLATLALFVLLCLGVLVWLSERLENS